MNADDLSRRVVEAAMQILADKGSDGLTTRAIAAAADTTTMTIYSRFGGKEGILRALFNRGFAMLASQLSEVPGGDEPAGGLTAACVAYRAFAAANPGLYSVMMETAQSELAGESDGSAARAFDELRRRVSSCIPEADSTVVLRASHSVWAICHGSVSLERSGIGSYQLLDGYDEALENAVTTYMRGVVG